MSHRLILIAHIIFCI